VTLLRCGHAVEFLTLFKNPDERMRNFDETFSKTMRKMWVQFAKTGDPSLSADISPDGKEKVWPLYDLKDKKVMIFDEFDIHPEKESERGIVDWDRTYFLTKYYCF
jgi:para-nitrobenzyl esterase